MAEVMPSASLHVCLSACLLAHLKSHTSKFRDIFCMLPVDEAQFSFDDSAICCADVVMDR